MGNKPSRPCNDQLQSQMHKLSEILPNLYLSSRQTAMKASIYRDYDITSYTFCTFTGC